MKTFAPNANKIQKNWHLVDAKGKILGKLATEVAITLMGKDKPEYAPNAEVGDKVVIVNAKDIVVTGNKKEDKEYIHYTGFPGGLRRITFSKLMEKKPTEAVRKAIMGMLPKNRLRKLKMANLYIYEGDKHPHTAQLAK